MPSRVLIIEDTPSLARLYAEYLRREGVEILQAETGATGLAQLASSAPQVLLLDLQLPDMNGLDILQHIESNNLGTAVVVITAHGSIGNAVEAMRAGAYDFLVKPFNADRLLITVRNALEHQRLSRIVTTLKQDFGTGRFCGFIGSSLPMQAVYRIIDSAAKSKATVFITGESGTGKEVCADAIHQKSPRSGGPFIALNCGAIPHDLMESEIFGHVKGAFTGASSDRDGAAQLAHRGTLFLDEICEMDLNLQTKLLRFLQTGSFTKVGGSKVETVDVRYICATNRDPWAEVQAGRFREDLFYRLHVVPIAMPPLREREDDVVTIATELLRRFSAEEGKDFTAFDSAVEAQLRAYPWPGNVRQLQNVLRNIVVLHDGPTVTANQLPPPLNSGAAATAPLRPASFGVATTEKTPAPDAAIRPLWQVERETIEQAIARCDGNIVKAAALLEISASTIYRKRASWGEAAPEEALV